MVNVSHTWTTQVNTFGYSKCVSYVNHTNRFKEPKTNIVTFELES